MKKAVSLLMIIALIFTLFSCAPKYEPVPSTEEEARVLITLAFDGESYEIKYELYRAFFLTYKNEVDGGDESVWTGESADEYIARIDKLIVSRAAEIFATLHAAKKAGFDPYSADVESKILDYVRVSVEGGTVPGYKLVEGEGSYEEYLAALREMNLNYSVQTLLIRYSLATAALEEYYLGREDDIFEEGGEFEFDEVDVREYYFGEDAASYMQIFLYSHAYDATRVEEIRNSVASQGTKKAVAEYMVNFSTASYEEIFDGSVVGRYELDRVYYSELSDAIFSLGTGETSAPIKVGRGKDEGYYIIYKLAATEDYFDNHYELVERSYIINALGKNLQSYEAALASSAVFTEAYNEIIHADIEMD